MRKVLGRLHQLLPSAKTVTFWLGRQLAAKRKALDAQIAALQAEGEAEEAEVTFTIAQETLQTSTTRQNADAMSHLRGGPKGDNGQAEGKP